jgi:hypothetical protein
MISTLFAYNLVLGPLRLLLFIAFIYAINLLVIKPSKKKYGLDLFIYSYAFFVSFLILLILFLTQFNSYDLIVVGFIFLLIAVNTFLDIDFKKPVGPQLKHIRTRFILYIIKSIEFKTPILGEKNFKKSKNELDQQKRTIKLWQVSVGVILVILCFASRFYFFKYDNYTLSDFWYQDLSNIKEITQQHWFLENGTSLGEMAIINFYALITGISDAVALSSFALITTSLLALVIFWMLNRITRSLVVPGFTAAMVFIYWYCFLPLNVNLMTQPKSIFLALTLAFPLLTYLFVNDSKKLQQKKAKILFVLFVLAIALVNWFVALVIIPILLLIYFIFNIKKQAKQVIIILSYYVLSILILTLTYSIIAFHQGKDLGFYFITNLFSFNYYTYAPQLILPLKQLYIYYYIASVILCVLSIVLYVKNAFKYKAVAMLSCFLVAIFSLYQIQWSFIDLDILNLILVASIPLGFGLIAFYITELMSFIKLKTTIKIPIQLVSITILVLAVLYGFESQKLKNYPVRNPINAHVLKVYDLMDQTLLPFSYAIVNREVNSRIGEDKHYFINYQEFDAFYMSQDETYYKFKTNESYLKYHPEIVLPQSVFVFIYNKEVVLNTKNSLDIVEQLKAQTQLELLLKKGRKIDLFYDSKELKVYEIINEPKASHIDDLFF